MIRRRRTFLDRTLESDFRERGFVTTPLVDPSHVSSLLKLYTQHRPVDASGFHVTLLDPDATTRAAVSKAICDVVSAPALALLTDHRLSVGTFVVKEPSGDSTKTPHLDSALTDEPRYRSVGVWMPLVDTNETNGMLWVLEGSHRASPSFRPPTNPMTKWAAEAVDRSPAHLRVCVPLEAGHAILFDHALVHWSGPNLSPLTRVATAAAALPNAMPAVCDWTNEHGERQRWAVPDSYRLTKLSVPPEQVGELLKC